jgi:hypothetical protein
MDVWLKTKFVVFIRNLIKKENEKNYIESQDLFGEELYQMQNKENSKRKKSFVLKLFDNNKIINRRNSFKYSSSTELIKDIKLCKKNNCNYFVIIRTVNYLLLQIWTRKKFLCKHSKKKKIICFLK